MGGDKRDRTVVVAVPADHAPNLRLRGAMLATSALPNTSARRAKRVLLIMDSLTRVAHAAREIGLLLGEPGAARGYPPSALATITKLVERAGNSAAKRRLGHRALHRAGRWRQPGRSGGRYRPLDPRRAYRAIARSGAARAISGDRHRRLAQPRDERHYRGRTPDRWPARSARWSPVTRPTAISC
jgi:hypothetical protein